MYLKDGYFKPEGPHPADDIGQGYLTRTVPAGNIDDLPEDILAAAQDNPEILDQFRLDETLTMSVATEPNAESFEIFRNSEVAFDGLSDCGYLGYGLDVAFSQTRHLALVAYTGPGLPSIVRRYSCGSPDEAVDLWQQDWAEPLIFSPALHDEDELPESPETVH